MKKMLIIINKNSVKISRNLEEKLKSKFEGFLVEIVTTNNASQAKELTKIAVENKYDIVVACGGDGTINKIINEITYT